MLDHVRVAAELDAGGSLRTVGPAAVAGGVRDLRLPPRPSKPEELGRLRELLGVDLLVSGRYRMSEPGAEPAVTVDLEVLDTASGATLATVHETGPLTGLGDLAGRAGRRLRRAAGAPELSPTEAEGLRRAHPRDVESARHYAEGLSLMRVFDFPAAVAAFQNALEIDPDSVPARTAFAQALAWSGRKKQAQAEIDRALHGASDLPRELQLVIESDACEMAGEWERAIEIGRSLHVLYPDHIEYGLSLASLMASHGRGEEAGRVLSELRRLPAPLGLDPRIDLADAWMHESDLTGKLAAASRAAERARELGARLLLASARIQQGRAYRGLGKPDEALAAFEEAWRLREAAGDESGVGRALRHVAAVERDRGQFVEAADHLRVAAGIADRLGEVDQQVGSQRDLAALALDMDALGESSRHIEAGRAAAGDRTVPEESAWLDVEAARLAVRSGPPANAVAAARAAAESCAAEKLSSAEARARALLALALVAAGDLEAAAAESAAAGRLAATTDDRGIRLEVALAVMAVGAARSNCGSAAPSNSRWPTLPTPRFDYRKDAKVARADMRTRHGDDAMNARSIVEDDAERIGLGGRSWQNRQLSSDASFVSALVDA